jgi:hypothetical protein
MHAGLKELYCTINFMIRSYFGAWGTVDSLSVWWSTCKKHEWDDTLMYEVQRDPVKTSSIRKFHFSDYLFYKIQLYTWMLDPMTMQVPHKGPNHTRIFSFHAAMSGKLLHWLHNYTPSSRVQRSHTHRFKNPCQRFRYVGTSAWNRNSEQLCTQHKI